MNNYHGRALCMATFNGGNITLISFLNKNCANSPCMSVIRLAVLPPSSCLCPPQQECLMNGNMIVETGHQVPGARSQSSWFSVNQCRAFCESWQFLYIALPSTPCTIQQSYINFNFWQIKVSLTFDWLLTMTKYSHGLWLTIDEFLFFRTSESNQVFSLDNYSPWLGPMLPCSVITSLRRSLCCKGQPATGDRQEESH